MREADLICAEDTRTSRRLLEHYDIHTPITSYHEHNKRSKLPGLLEKLRSGQKLAVISDAGSPGISDPGEELVAACMQEGIPVRVIPGPAAIICAATGSGLSCRRLAFEAFLPVKKKKRLQVLEELKHETRTIVIYEAPHHLRSTLNELYETLGNRRAALCRELTKLHEETLEMSLSDAIDHYSDREPKGEYVIVIDGKTFSQIEEEKSGAYDHLTIEEHVRGYMDQGMDPKSAIKQTALDRNIPKRQVYDAVNGIKRGGAYGSD